MLEKSVNNTQSLQAIADHVIVASQQPFWHYIVGPIAIIIVGCSGAFWAWRAIEASRISAKNALEESRKIAKQRATIDYIMERTKDDRFVDSYLLISAIDQLSTVDIKCFANVDEDVDLSSLPEHFGELTFRKCKNALSYVLNQFEHMSVAVEKDIYDEDILIECSRTSTVAMFDLTDPYIKHARKLQLQKRGKPSTSYIKYEALVTRWRSN
ncbi:MAG: hypothetical protein ACI9WC_000262 [Arenicella sp.]|jgi:hypothetical protein